MYPFLNNNGSNSNPEQEHYHTPLSYSPFVLPPSPIYIPLEDEAVFYDFLRQQHDQFLFNDHNHNNEQILTNNVKLAEHDDSLRIKRVISSNRDRHSKIHTARGLRDRRIRLSCDVAKKFFGLQDLLGFDMASKTVDWLLTESKTAILDLLPDPKCSFVGVSNYTVSFTSECEVVSGSTGDDQAATKNKAKSCSRVRKCANFNQHLAKETRIRARQRARERTIEKQNKYKHDVCQDPIFRSCLDQLVISDQVSWS
ncbi:hypothetical protein QVD17_15943 [Tagetes erecta]|uniref:Cycloidea-like protein n=1 Tax=Tagetes erecta TaxID=13708 RepID=A0AAD8NT33_TARER|nr:hypothetical protein QVD17_15943 [Tagetes erecta]